MNRTLQDFFIKNAWSIIMIIVAMILFYADTNARLGNIEVKAEEARSEAISLRTLIERVIVLEERDRSVKEDIAEIKADVKKLLMNH